MMRAPDVVVAGLGAHGAALVHELARRGVSVLGLDMHTPPHEYGSTTGRTRITRQAYYEDPLYVPLVQRAGELWAEIEELTGTVLYRQTGGLMAGRADCELVRGCLASAERHGLPHEVLGADGIRRRFQVLQPDDDVVGVYEPNAGVLLLDACIRTLLEQAVAYGAEIRTGTRVTGWRANGAGVTLETTSGSVHAGHAVFAVGSWLNPLLASEQGDAPVQLQLTIERQTAHWFGAAPGVHGFSAAECPVTMLALADGRMLYTLPDVGHGLKAALHHDGATVTADTVDRTVGSAEEERVRALLQDWMPGAGHRVLDGGVCLYTNTPDRHFVVDRHPSHGNVLLVSACSGHGFKFATALAEVTADLALEGDAAFDVAMFAVDRVLASQPAPPSSSHG
ncbi:MAG TPA: N-methyl-L-tryptophan oxidase [Longimicrobiales bacterium]|nr:N-methyl-L-tryptophan oxidase [Longimicrobiales bacterium]